MAVAVDTYNGAVADVAQTVRGGGKGGLSTDKYGAAMVDNAVRRLTPMECERLQGFPDNWTEGQSDSARYRQMGNAVAVPVVEWIIERLVAVDSE
jgi:DNA (cytosine-5)-methyltransferase 1